MDKSIDLGKLQSDLREAKSRERKAITAMKVAERKMKAAQAVYDGKVQSRCDAEKAVDAARRAMLETARTVAAG